MKYLILSLIFYFSTQAQATETQPFQQIKVVKEISRTGELVQPEETSIDIEQYKGKVVIIKMWATWCGYCIYSFKEKVPQLLAEFGDDIVVLALTKQTLDGDKNIFTSFAKKHIDEIPEQVQIYQVDVKDNKFYQTSYVPYAYVINPQGKLVFAGATSGEMPGGDIQFFADLLKGKGLSDYPTLKVWNLENDERNAGRDYKKAVKEGNNKAVIAALNGAYKANAQLVRIFDQFKDPTYEAYFQAKKLRILPKLIRIAMRGVYLKSPNYSQQNVEEQIESYLAKETDAESLNKFAWSLANPKCKSPEIYNPKLSLRVARKAVELAPNDWHIQDTLANALTMIGDYDGAIAAYANILQKKMVTEEKDITAVNDRISKVLDAKLLGTSLSCKF